MPELIQSLLKLPPSVLAFGVLGTVFVILFTIALFIPRKKNS